MNEKPEILEEKVDYKGVRFSVLDNYGDDLTAKKYITNPAIAREDELKKLMIVLLTPEKSGLLIGKAGIGKTAIVEGLAYLIQRNEVPNALQGFRVVKFNSTSLVGKILLDNEDRLIMGLLVDELKVTGKTIVFIDEIHTLIGGKNSGPMDLANMLKPGLDRGTIKAIGATTDIEYNTYVIRDRAFLRRFDRIDVLEPNEETTIKILMGTIPKIEAQTGIKFKYNAYMTEKLIASIVSATSEFKRIYGLAAMYPDVSLSVLTQSFSQALFKNESFVTAEDVYNAIKTSKRIYPDSIVKELKLFKEKFQKLIEEEKLVLPDVTVEEIKSMQEDY
jgi:ATP-dependent Clp protease ATP-binding subunit ClpB